MKQKWLLTGTALLLAAALAGGALALAWDEEHVWLLGGGSIDAALLCRGRRASVTRVESTVSDADTFFPDLDALPNWKIERTGEAVTENDLTYRFVDYVNTAPL